MESVGTDVFSFCEGVGCRVQVALPETLCAFHQEHGRGTRFKKPPVLSKKQLGLQQQRLEEQKLLEDERLLEEKEKEVEKEVWTFAHYTGPSQLPDGAVVENQPESEAPVLVDEEPSHFHDVFARAPLPPPLEPKMEEIKKPTVAQGLMRVLDGALDLLSPTPKLPLFVVTEISVTAFFRENYAGVKFEALTEEEARVVADEASRGHRLYCLTKDRNERNLLSGFLKLGYYPPEDARLFRNRSSRVLICTVLNTLGLSYTLVTPLRRKADGTYEAAG